MCKTKTYYHNKIEAGQRVDNEELSLCCEAPFNGELYKGFGRCRNCGEMSGVWRDEVPMPVEWKTREERLKK